jgi:hypothetical protein
MSPTPIILLRVASLPTSTVEAFRCTAVLRTAEEVEAAFSRLEARRQARCDALHKLVPRQSNRLRRELLDLKRAVHNHRAPVKTLASPLFGDLLAADGGLAEDMRAWQHDVEEVGRKRAEGETALESDWVRLHDQLRSVWQNELLQRGILYAHPELYRDLDSRAHWVSGHSTTGRPIHKRELALLAYTYRAATKTSPFSTFTLTGIGHVADDAPALRAPDVRHCVFLPVLSPAVLRRIARRWLARPDVVAKARLRTPDVLDIEGGRIAFLTTANGDGTEEIVRSVSNAPVASLIVQLMRTSVEGHSLRSLRRLVANNLQCDEARVSDLLLPLKDLGLLEPVLPFDACRPNAVEDLLAAVFELDVPDLESERDTVASLVTQVRTLSWSSLAEQAAALAATESAVGRLLGLRKFKSGGVVFDRCAVAESVSIPSCVMREVTPLLEKLLDLLPLFNVDLGAFSVVQEFFRERCSGNRALGVLPSFMQLWEHFRGRHPGHGQDPFQLAADSDRTATEANSERRTLVAELLGSLRGASMGGVELSAGFLMRWAGRARRFAPGRAPLSASFLGQFITNGSSESMSFVLNGIAPGYAALAAAWASGASAYSAGNQLRTDLLKALSALDPEGDVVEIAAALDFGGQVRDRLTKRFLSYPSSPHLERENERIDWDDLGLFLDETLDRIVLGHRRTRRRVLPVHLGTISPTHFPPFYRFLLALGPAFTPSFSVVDFVEEQLTGPQRSVPRRYARVVSGRSLIVSRETWCIPSAELLRFGGAALTFGEYLDLRRWARQLDLPRTAFVTGAQAGDIQREGLDVRAVKRVRKPFFVDFDDYASCLLFRRYIPRAGSTVRFVEALPWGAGNPFRSPEGPRVVELAIEVQGKARP